MTFSREATFSREKSPRSLRDQKYSRALLCATQPRVGWR